MLERLSDHLYRFQDTCHVYIVVDDDRAILVDLGAGDVLDEVAALGVRTVTDVLITHHHRDQVQGLERAVAAGARIWVPEAERQLIEDVEGRWLARDVWNNYNTREDRFSRATSVPVAGALPEYRPTTFGALEVTAIPLPGHTVGSVGLLFEVDGQRVACVGDLLAGPGRLWSLAATMWSYAGPEGLAMTWASLQALARHELDLLLPSHGVVMEDPPSAIALTAARVRELLDLRGQHLHLAERWSEPFEQVSEHLLYNRSSHARSYVLLSDTGGALLVDFGYDFETGLPAGTDRAARRPWLATVPVLKERYAVERLEVVVPTHYHDDHVAGFNLLRAVEGTEVWAADIVSEVLRDPAAYDLPCLWYEPIGVDREVPVGGTVRWHEYELTMHHLPGHTLHAVAIEAEVDGQRVLFTGDQTDGDGRLNYVYPNRFRREDYRVTGALYERLAPDLLLTGHWGPMSTEGGLLTEIRARGEELERLHEGLLGGGDVDLGAEGFAAWMRPYQATIEPGGRRSYTVEVRNPLPGSATVTVALVVPPGWAVTPPHAAIDLPAQTHGTVAFEVTAGSEPTRRAVLLADVWAGERHLGQHAEALVAVR